MYAKLEISAASNSYIVMIMGAQAYGWMDGWMMDDGRTDGRMDILFLDPEGHIV